MIAKGRVDLAQEMSSFHGAYEDRLEKLARVVGRNASEGGSG